MSPVFICYYIIPISVLSEDAHNPLKKIAEFKYI